MENTVKMFQFKLKGDKTFAHVNEWNVIIVEIQNVWENIYSHGSLKYMDIALLPHHRTVFISLLLVNDVYERRNLDGRSNNLMERP